MAKKRPAKKSVVSVSKRKPLPLTIKMLMDEYIYLIDLDADYQREKVWSSSDQQKLLDSILRDIDIPKLYLAKIHDGKQFEYECIDGKQRLITLRSFFQLDEDEGSPLLIDVHNRKYTYEQLKEEHPRIAKEIEDYQLDFVIYDEASLDENFIRKIFRRLQLGKQLNSGEVLNSLVGTIRDFVFKEVGNNGPFFRKTKLSERRYSRQFTLAQICINAFREESDEFVRARLEDLEEFFADNSRISKSDENLERIRKILKIMDEHFGESAQIISSRATAVTAYLFIEDLFRKKKQSLVPRFVQFYVTLLKAIEHNMDLVRDYRRPENIKIMHEFQTNITQASVEPYSITRRQEFLEKAFAFYRKRGKIIR